MSGAYARHGQRKTDHFFPDERSQHLSPDFLGDHEQAQGHQFRVRKVPDLSLQVNGRAQFFNALALADLDRIASHAWDFSSSFACCHKDSSSSVEACSALRPD